MLGSRICGERRADRGRLRKLAIDWDGTCVTSEWPYKSTTWMPGAVEALTELSKHARIVIHTARISPMWTDEVTQRKPADVQAEINYIRDMLDSAGLTGIRIHTDPWKPGADAYVDDKAVHYAGRSTSWGNVTEKLLTMLGVDTDVDPFISTYWKDHAEDA